MGTKSDNGDQNLTNEEQRDRVAADVLARLERRAAKIFGVECVVPNDHHSVPPNHNVIGSCSICSGPVVVPTHWAAIVPPTPYCASCGAVRSTHGPVIDMKPAPGQGTPTAYTHFRLY